MRVGTVARVQEAVTVLQVNRGSVADAVAPFALTFAPQTSTPTTHLQYKKTCNTKNLQYQCCRYTAEEVKQLVGKRRLAGNNNTAGQYEGLRAHLVVSARNAKQPQHGPGGAGHHTHSLLMPPLSSVHGVTSSLASMHPATLLQTLTTVLLVPGCMSCRRSASLRWLLGSPLWHARMPSTTPCPAQMGLIWPPGSWTGTF